ncbi:MAG: glycosyltransferase family 2 protein [Bacteroidales bacterium]|jgi:dolichol-phosphate mannosyltransferase|nr:glycosyltransferase family 2 protein [Bacteroidales bacterium]
MQLSVVIPLYNEATVVDALLSRTLAALDSFCPDFELIVVDDGSSDMTLPSLLAYQQADPRIRVIELSRNFGHQAAFTAGLEHARGQFIAMMDGDLQDPPEVLGAMYERLASGQCDVASGKRTERHGNKAKNGMTNIFHFLFQRLAGLRGMENAGNFCMMNRDALYALLSLDERVRYLPGLRAFIGFRQEYVEYARDARFDGTAKMSLFKLLTLATDAIFSFSRTPVRLCLTIGLVGALVFFIAGIYVLIAKGFGFAIPGWSSTLLSIYFLGSIQLVFLGVVGEYVYRIYKESQRRPHYFIRKIHELPE